MMNRKRISYLYSCSRVAHARCKLPFWLAQNYMRTICIRSTEVRFAIKRDSNPNDKYVYRKEHFKSCILIPVLSKSVKNVDVVDV